MNISTKKTFKSFFISTLVCSSMMGCDMFKKTDRPVPKEDMTIPSTPPLQAGASVSKVSRGITTTGQIRSQRVELEKTKQAVVKPAQAIKLVTAKTASFVTNKVTPGTPEATLKIALDTVYSGDAKEATQYYYLEGVSNIDKELQAAQQDFQETIESVTFQNTTFNNSKTEAEIDFDVKIKGKRAVEKRNSLMKKIDGKWKIIG